MLLSDPSAHGSLETPVDVQGKATRDLKQSTTATERWHYAIKLEQVLRPIGVPEGKIDFFLGVVLGVGLVIA